MASDLFESKSDVALKQQVFLKDIPADKIHSSKGQHECQESGGGEVDLLEHYKNCKKNPGHTKFIPVTTFNIQHLPDGLRDNDLYELIKSTADLTVRIGVKMVSPHRPEFLPNTKVPYPFYNKRGNVNMRTGSGEITVLKYIDGCGFDDRGNEGALENKYDREYKTCPCEKCQHSDKHNNVWWEIFVNTATHVVFDDIEASHTSCRLFYDEQDSHVVILDKVTIDYENIEEDWCVLKYVTCDVTLGNKLYTMAAHCRDLWNKIGTKYINRSDVKLSFIVSHPHGCTKQISFGQWMDNNVVSEYDKDFNLTKLTYTTCTCPGSSGAKVYCVGFKGGSHVHCGTLDSRINYSGIGYFLK